MKQLKSILAATTLLFMPAGAMAQKHIQEAFDNFLNKHDVLKNEYRAEQDKNKTKKDFLKIYTFTLKAADKKDLEAIKKAFNKDADMAYQVTTLKKGTTLASYALRGPEDTKAFVGEKYDNTMMQNFTDPNDSTRRYSYAMEWTDKEEGTTIGQIISCYSLKPNYRKTNYRLSFNDFERMGAKYIDVNKDVRKRYNADKIGNYFSKTERSNTYYEINGVHKLASELSSTEWLSNFNGMRDLVYRIPNGIQTSYYVSTIYDLCQNVDQLDADTKKLVKNEVEKLRAKVKDKFLKNMLLNAMKNL